MSTKPENVDTPQGLAFALTAYVMWGFMPLYMKMLAHIPPIEVVAHRVIWSVPIAGVLLLLLGRMGDLKAALRSPRVLLMGCVTAAFVSVNWGIYVWSVLAMRWKQRLATISTRCFLSLWGRCCWESG